MIGARLIQESFRAMGTDCVVAVTACRSDAPRARRALTAAAREVGACERVLSRFLPDSDLSRLNGASGTWVAVDHRLVAALRVALCMREKTGGTFDPTILPALVATGYDRSFEQLDGREASRNLDWRPAAIVEFDTISGSARVEQGAAVDLGGIGKGLAASRALLAMRGAWAELPGGLIDLGGDHRGLGRDARGWPVAALRRGPASIGAQPRYRYDQRRRGCHLRSRPATFWPRAAAPPPDRPANRDVGEIWPAGRNCRRVGRCGGRSVRDGARNHTIQRGGEPARRQASPLGPPHSHGRPRGRHRGSACPLEFPTFGGLRMTRALSPVPIRRRRSAWIVVASALVGAVAFLGAGCAGGGMSGSQAGTQSPASFVDRITTEFSRGQSGRLWDELIPLDQRVVTRARFVACQANEGWELKSIKVLETYDDPVAVGAKSIASKAVTVRVTSDDGITTATMHAVPVNGKWRWVLQSSDRDAYAAGKCPRTGSRGSGASARKGSFVWDTCSEADPPVTVWRALPASRSSVSTWSAPPLPRPTPRRRSTSVGAAIVGSSPT